MSILSKATYKFNTTPVRILVTYFCKNRKIHSKIHIKSQGTLKFQNNLEKEQNRRPHPPCFFPDLLQSYSNQDMCPGMKTDIQTRSWNSEPRNIAHLYGQMISTRVSGTLNGETKVFSTNSVKKVK